MSFEFSASYTQSLGIDIKACKNLNDAYDASNKLISLHNQPQLFASFLLSLDIPREYHSEIIHRYSTQNFTSLLEFAPYAAHVIKIDMFFYISVARGFISGERPSNKIDMSYLYYLPFCNIFISGDKLHRKTAHLFMNKNQKFIWAPDLKADLNNLNKYYKGFSQAEKELGLYAFASYPPIAIDSLTSTLWDEFLPDWKIRMNSNKESKEESKQDTKLLDELKKHSEAPKVEGNNFDEDNIEHMTLKRSISKKRGSWYQLPKDLKH